MVETFVLATFQTTCHLLLLFLIISSLLLSLIIVIRNFLSDSQHDEYCAVILRFYSCTP